MELLVLLRAEADSQRIFNGLENIQEGRGELFLRNLRFALAQLRAFPESAPVLRFPYRRKLIRRFPYGIVYSIESGHLVIVTIIPLRQNPDKLRSILDRPED